jgi:transcriptional regulator GlxA family with amidase domain
MRQFVSSERLCKRTYSFLMSRLSALATRGRSMTVRRRIATVPGMASGRVSRCGHALVEQAEALAFAEPTEPLHVSALCRTLEVSERTLRKAFHRAHGVPPCRHLRMLRLSQVRRALLSANSKFATVTEVATAFGFVELGRFSVEYRKTFGESPSQTLQRAFRQQAPAGSNFVLSA